MLPMVAAAAKKLGMPQEFDGNVIFASGTIVCICEEFPMYFLPLVFSDQKKKIMNNKNESLTHIFMNHIEVVREMLYSLPLLFSDKVTRKKGVINKNESLIDIFMKQIEVVREILYNLSLVQM